MSNKILFPTEFGELGAKARLTAALMAQKLNAELVIMHAIHPPKGINRFFSSYDETAVRDQVERQLYAYAEQMRADGAATVSTLIGEGAPEHAIVDSARDIEATMIIFGTIGGEGLRGSLLGSAVNYVIRHAHCPVLTVRNPPGYLGFRRIMVQLETLRETPEQVVWSVQVAKLFDAELHFLGLMTGDNEHNVQLDNRVRNALKYAREHGIERSDMHLEPLDHATEYEIEEYADHIRADLICVLTQSDDEKGVRSLLRGSVADRVVNLSQHPVLSVTPHY
ncbi:MAG: universal stress protein [Bacteroidota bacterium]